MEIKSLKLACFSPTGTTMKVIQAVAQGMNQNNMELIDITRPDARKQPLETSENDLLVVGVPVYMGRVPALLQEWLLSLKAHKTPAVCVVVYGNRVYDDALLELKDCLKQRGFIPMAGAAYIGEHSFSSLDTPIAEARPDAGDLSHAELFGREVAEKLQSISSVDQISEISVPGNYPYGGVTDLWDVDFIAVSDQCSQCGICAQTCPVAAIDSKDSNRINIVNCITCCACIKNCPQNARVMKTGQVMDAANRLSNLYKERKEPVSFI